MEQAKMIWLGLLGAMSVIAGAGPNFNGQVLMRVDSPAMGSAFIFHKGDSCVALTAAHVVAGAPHQRLADGYGGTWDGSVEHDWSADAGLDVALIRIKSLAATRCPEPPDPSLAAAALRQPVGLVLSLDATNSLKRIAVTVDAVSETELILRPLHSDDAAYAALSGSMVYFGGQPVGVVYNSPIATQLHAVPLWALAEISPNLFVTTVAQVVKYDLDQLPETIRNVAIQARQSRERAEDIAQRADAEADKGNSAAVSADNKIAGFGIFIDDAGDARYRGQILPLANEAVADGSGCREILTGSATGDIYCGTFSKAEDGRASGLGIMSYVKNDDNFNNLIEFKGQFDHGLRSGYGILIGPHATWYGRFVSDGSDGPTSIDQDGGTRLEIEFHNGMGEGYGVLWDANGQIVRCGLWKAGNFQGPVSGCPG